jgi:hypothetical protein
MSWNTSPSSSTPKKKIKHHESELQKNCVKWFRFAYPQLIIFSIPNGGSRNVIEAVRLKDEGLLAGVCDLFLPKPNTKHSGLFIEMKSPGGKPTPAQVSFMEKMLSLGYDCKVCYSFDDFKLAVDTYLTD